MKKLLGIVVLGLLISGNALSENLPVKIFGITINDDAEKYVDINKGKSSKSIPGIISYFEGEELEIKGLIKNENLEYYYLRTDTNNKIMIAGASNRLEWVPIKEFNNKCSDLKLHYIKTLSNYYEFNSSKFKYNYYKYVNDDNRVWFYDSAEFNFKKNSSKLTLQILCNYTRFEDDIVSRLYITLSDQKYFENLTNNRWTKIKNLDDDIIKSNLKGF